jgi:hypothetical protein
VCFLVEVSFLGHIITDGGIAVDPSKVRDVLNWSPPKNVPEIRSFLGLQDTIEDSSRDFLRL